MPELHWTEVRGHVEPADSDDGDDESPDVTTAIGLDETMLTHVVADDREQPVCTFFVVLRGNDATVAGVAPARGIDTETRTRIRSLARRQSDAIRDTPTVFQVISPTKLWTRIHNRVQRRGGALGGWDLAWQLGRQQIHTGSTRDGAFSMAMPGGGVVRDGRFKDSDYRARISVKANAGGATFFNFKVPRDPGSRRVGAPGRMFDLKSLVSTVCGGDVETQAEAAKLLGVEWPEPTGDELADAWAQLQAEVELLKAARRDLRNACPSLKPHRAYTTGSMVTAIRRAAGIPFASRALRRASMRHKGAMASAFFGPRCECHLAGIVCPTALVDIVSTYPACWHAAWLTPLLIADHLELEDATEEFLTFLANPNLRDLLYDRATARRWGATIVLVSRSRGAQLPAVVEWSEARSGGTVAARWFDDPDGTALPWADVASAVANGEELEVLEALRPEPAGIASSLRPYRLPDGTEVDLTTEDLGHAWIAMRVRARPANGRWTPPRRRRVGVAKLGGNGDTFGIDAQQNRRTESRAMLAKAIGPHGEELERKTRHPEVPAADTSLLLAGAVTAMCRLAIGLLIDDVHALGGSILHVATDSVAIAASREGGLWPCPGGPHPMADGREAILLLSFDQVRALIARYDALLGHDGGSAFKEEAETLTHETFGIAFGINKLVLARFEADGALRIVKSSDTNLGGHLADPVGTAERTADGLWRWSADLEALLVLAALATDPEPPIGVSALPGFAGRLALHVGQATTFKELEALRKAIGDPMIGPFARFLWAETGGSGAVPLSLGTDRGPATWARRDWRVRGKPACLGTKDADGSWRYAAGDASATLRVTVRSVADHLARWLDERDASMTGPKRGLRHPTPVHSHPALARVVGRTGEPLGDGSPSYPTLVYGNAVEWEVTRKLGVEVTAAEIVRRGGPPLRTVSDALKPGSNPDDRTRALIVAALSLPASRSCVGCGAPVKGRIDRKWCGDDCRKRTARKAARTKCAGETRKRRVQRRDREVAPRGVVQMARRGLNKTTEER
jgi:hypothetical protein